MNKYVLLMALNIPFVIFGVVKSFAAFKSGAARPIDLILRMGFWLVIFAGLVFAEDIYQYLFVHGLTDSTPLSIADVVLVTGLNVCLFLIMRLYTKIERQDKRFNDLHEKISIKLSTKK